jgi:hypothetical protein
VKREFHTILLLVLFQIHTIEAAFEDIPSGGRPLGLGSAYVAVAEGSEALMDNPAGLSQNKHASLCLFLSRPFGLKELTYETITITLPTRFGNWGFGFQNYGNPLYREKIVMMGWAHHYCQKIFLGIGFRMAQLHIEKYGSDHTFILDAGCLVKLSRQLQWGASVFNLFQSRIGKNREPLPQIMKTGLCYKPFDGVTIAFQLDKDVHYPLEIRGGIEICPLSPLLLRFGFGREPDLFSAGFGLIWKNCTFDYAFTMHPILGVTHQGSISFHLKPIHQKPLQILH